MRRIFKAGFKIILFVTLAAAALGAFAVPNTMLAYRGVQEARREIADAEGVLLHSAAMDIAVGMRRLEEASAHLRSAERALYRMNYLQLAPWISGQWKSARTTLRGAADAVDALVEIGRTFTPIMDALRAYGDIEIGAIDPEKREELLRGIYDSLPALQTARADVQLALRQLSASVPLWSPELEEERARIIRALAEVLGVLRDGIPLLETMLPVIGFPEPTAYLFVLQNSDELRPSGGFIGTYGLITFDSGHITGFLTDDVYNLDRFVPGRVRPPAPEPIRRYLEQPYWYLRDANFDPDFPTSAQRILQFYREEARYQSAAEVIGRDQPESREPGITPIYARNISPSDLDGVIAIMPEAIRPLLEIVGPITVDGQIFTAENLTDVLEYEVEIGFGKKGIPRPQRKEIVSKLGHALIARILELSPEKWPNIARVVRGALDEKHIMIFARDSDLREQIVEQTWAGNIAAASGQDYFGVFDANMFSLKTDPYVTRSIFYKVRSTQSGPMGELEIVYSYPTPGPAWKTKGYRTWTRVYAPKGAVLISASGAMAEEGITRAGEVEIGQEHGKTVFGAFLAVQAGETKRLRFTYRLPEEIAERLRTGSYALFAQKQPGTVGHSLTVTADFGKVPRVWEPRGLSVSRDETKLTWQGSLRKDQAFRIEF